GGWGAGGGEERGFCRRRSPRRCRECARECPPVPRPVPSAPCVHPPCRPLRFALDAGSRRRSRHLINHGGGPFPPRPKDAPHAAVSVVVLIGAAIKRQGVALASIRA